MDQASHTNSPLGEPRSASPGSAQPFPNGTTCVPQKRRRISLACTNCRRRKSKCNGLRPTCSMCLQLEVECVYTEIYQQSEVRRSSNSRAQLIQKVKELEDRLRTSTAPSSHHNIDGIMPGTEQGVDDTPAVHTRQGLYETNPTHVDPCRSDEEATVDERAAGVFQDENAPDIGHFGPSSNHAFFRSISRAFAHILSTAAPRQDQRRTLAARPASEESREVFPLNLGRTVNTDFVGTSDLPLAPDTFHLIDCFFATIGVALPFISKPALVLIYKNLCKEGSSSRSSTNRALLNIVFALSSATIGEPKRDVYYHRCMNNLDGSKLRGASIELLQTLLLTATYQQNHQKSVTSWTYHALAVKAALQLGLHSPPSYKEHGLQDGEMRKRLWYSLINQDRSLCICLGRPCLIPAQYVRTPELHDPKTVYRNVAALRNQDMEGLTYHRQLTTLYNIIASLLHLMYQDNIEADEPPTIWSLMSTRLQLQSQLEGWRRNLDSGFSILSADELNCSATISINLLRFQLFLSIHYYRAVLLLNGPLLTRLLDAMLNEPQPDADVESLLEQSVPIIRHEFGAIRDLHRTVCVVLAQDGAFLDQNNAWWLCNHTVSTLTMHLFCLVLFCHTRSALAASVGVSSTEVRRLLDESLWNMQIVQRTSTLSFKARQCLTEFTQIFDSISLDQQLTPDSLIDSSMPSLPKLTSGQDLPRYVAEKASNLIGYFTHDDMFGDNLFS